MADGGRRPDGNPTVDQTVDNRHVHCSPIRIGDAGDAVTSVAPEVMLICCESGPPRRLGLP
eukprot:2905717-Lingulodinium_polyedra.AAC.1